MSSTFGASCSSHCSATWAGRAEPGGDLVYDGAVQHRIALAAGQAERAERHERDLLAQALVQDRSAAAVGQVEQVLDADDPGAEPQRAVAAQG